MVQAVEPARTLMLLMLAPAIKPIAPISAEVKMLAV